MAQDLIQVAQEVQARYAQVLMEKANVVGTGVGYAQEGGEMSEEPAIIVMVREKLPEDQLERDDILPRSIEGVRIDVQETGSMNAGTEFEYPTPE